MPARQETIMRKEKLFVYISYQGEIQVDAYLTEEDIEATKRINKQKAEFPNDKSIQNQVTPYHTKESIIPNGQRVIFYNEKHALAHGGKMREYLGMVEVDPGNTEERKIYNMTVDEIRILNLPKIQPNKNINRVVVQGGRTQLWTDYFRGR